jgi:hypothetical protein
MGKKRVGLLAWALGLFAVLVGTCGSVPHSPRGWAILVIAGPPVYLALESLGERNLNARLKGAIWGAALATLAVAALLMVHFGWSLD